MESVAAAWTLGRITGGKVATLGTGDFFRFLLFCVMAICGGSAIFGSAASVFLGGNPSYLAAFFLWWAANAAGMLLITPLLLSLAPVVRREETIRKDRVVEMIAIAVVLCVSTVIVFVRSPSEPLTALSMFRRPWALLVPMMWAALRLHPRCIAFFSLLLWSIAIFFTSHGYGPGGWEYDVSNGRVTWTPEVYRIYGVDRNYDPNDVDRDIAQYAPDSAPVIERAFRNALEKGEPFDLELELIRGSGERIQIRTFGKATLENGKVVRVSGNIVDITEQKRAGEERRKLERELESAKKRESLGTMAGGIAHQFNNLLTAVLGHIELAEDSLPPASTASKHLREAEESALRASELGRAMLVYLGQGVRQRKRLDVDRLVREHLPLIRTELPGNVRLEIDVPPGGPAVFMDPADFRQVLSTLCTNAWEAIGEAEGVVRISVSAVRDAAEIPGSRYATGSVSSGPWACLKVTDTGAGMDRETMDRIFDPFFSTKFPGRGLGLPVVQGIVRHYGGAIHVRSHPGQGTMVSVLFPETEPVSAT